MDLSDYLIAILRSPTWIVPISKFIDDHCAIFEDVEENKLEYTSVHNRFKELIDSLLAAHLCELQITEEQFAEFCHVGLTGDDVILRSIVEELVSVDDFLVFKAMMVKRNADLGREVQACTAPPQEGGYEAGEAGNGNWEQAERLEAHQKCVEAELQMAQALEAQLEQRLELMEELNKVLDLICTVYKLQADVLAVEAAAEAAAAREAAEQQEAMAAQAALAMGNKVGLETVRLQPLAAAPPLPAGGGAAPDAAALQLEMKKAEAAMQRDRALTAAAAAAAEPAPAPAPAAPEVRAPAGPPRPTEAERQARAEHLRQSRAALLERKQREREAQLSAHQEQFGVTAASRAAEQQLRSAPQGQDGRNLAAELAGQQAPEPQATEADHKAQQMRQVLSRQLRATLTQQAPF